MNTEDYEQEVVYVNAEIVKKPRGRPPKEKVIKPEKNVLTEEQKLEKRREYHRNRAKERYHTDEEFKKKRDEMTKAYQNKNKEKKAEREKIYYQKTKETRKNTREKMEKELNELRQKIAEMQIK